MTYNIFGKTAPAMPKTSRGTEFVKIALSQASKDMQEVLIPMAMPALSAHLTETKFMYSDNKYYEMCGQMGHLIGPSGIGKAQLGHLVEAIMRPFRQHDEIEFKKLVDWQRQMKTKGYLQGKCRTMPTARCSSVQRPRCTSSWEPTRGRVSLLQQPSSPYLKRADTGLCALSSPYPTAPMCALKGQPAHSPGQAKRHPGFLYRCGSRAPCKGKSVNNHYNIMQLPFHHVVVQGVLAAPQVRTDARTRLATITAVLPMPPKRKCRNVPPNAAKCR